MIDFRVTFCVLLFSVCKTAGDYTCICSRHAQRAVYKNPGDTSFPIGSMYEDDCVPLLAGTNLQNWFAVATNGEVGYIFKDYKMDVTSCLGDPGPLPPLTPNTTSTKSSTAQTKPTSSAATTPTTSTTFSTSTVSATKPIRTTSMLSTSISSATTVSSSELPSSSPVTRPSTIQSTMSVAQNIWETPKPTSLSEACPAHMGIIAPGMWTSSGHWCYQFVAVRDTWQGAERMCNIHGGHLVTIESAQKEQFITSFLRNHLVSVNIWIGLIDRQRESFFKWSSGIESNYNNMDSGYSDPFADCVYLVPFTGKWRKSNCFLGFNFFICQFNKNTHQGLQIVG